MLFSLVGLYICVCIYICIVSHACSVVSNFFATLWMVTHNSPTSMGFSRQEYWSWLPFPFPGDLPHPGLEPTGSVAPELAGEFFTTESPRKPYIYIYAIYMPLYIYIMPYMPLYTYIFYIYIYIMHIYIYIMLYIYKLYICKVLLIHVWMALAFGCLPSSVSDTPPCTKPHLSPAV